MERLITTKFDIGSIVYLITDKEQLPRMVTGIVIKASGIIYELDQGTTSTRHYEIEMSDTINELIKVQ